jgi:hypothetical protein
MKKIFWGLALLVLVFSKTSFAKEENIYCLKLGSLYVSEHNYDRNIYYDYHTKAESFCNDMGMIEIPKLVYDKFRDENDLWFTKGSVDDPSDNSLFRKRPLRTNPEFIVQKGKALEALYHQQKEEIKKFNEEWEKEYKKIDQKKAEKEKQFKISELEKLYSGKCYLGYTKGTEKYNNCLLDQEKKDLAEKKKKQDLAEASKKKLETEAKQAADKIAKMSPDDRRAYICNEKYGFRKGSDNFKDCIFKIYTAEIELEKLELQKQLAKANADLAKVNAASREKLANAQTNAAIMQAYAAQQQAIAANTADSLALMESGLRMMSPQRPATRAPMNCQYHANMLSCF